MTQDPHEVMLGPGGGGRFTSRDAALSSADVAIHTTALVSDVAHEREALETRVSTLVALQGLQSGLDGLRDGTNDRREVLDATA